MGFDLNHLPLNTIVLGGGTTNTNLFVVNPFDEEGRIATLQDIDGADNRVQLSDTDQSDLEDDDEILEDNTDYSSVTDLQGETDEREEEWYAEEALPLGIIFGAKLSEDDRLKLLLQDLNLNFGNMANR